MNRRGRAMHAYRSVSREVASSTHPPYKPLAPNPGHLPQDTYACAPTLPPQHLSPHLPPGRPKTSLFSATGTATGTYSGDHCPTDREFNECSHSKLPRPGPRIRQALLRGRDRYEIRRSGCLCGHLRQMDGPMILRRG